MTSRTDWRRLSLPRALEQSRLSYSCPLSEALLRNKGIERRGAGGGAASRGLRCGVGGAPELDVALRSATMELQDCDAARARLS